MKSAFAKPALEVLENRLVPTTTLVNSTLTISTGMFNDSVSIDRVGGTGSTLRVTEVEHGRLLRITITEWNDSVGVQRISATLGAGHDQFFNNTGIDATVLGGTGQDSLYGGAGSDSLYGGDGDDLIYGYDGNDFLFGDNGDDQLFGGIGNDVLNGNAGADLLRGEYSND